MPEKHRIIFFEKEYFLGFFSYKKLYIHKLLTYICIIQPCCVI